jgi:curved DNA-binding protein CbpA
MTNRLADYNFSTTNRLADYDPNVAVLEPPVPFAGIPEIADPQDVTLSPKHKQTEPARKKPDLPWYSGLLPPMHERLNVYGTTPRAEFLKGFGKGFSEQTQIPALAGKKFKEPENMAEKIGKASGQLSEAITELVGLGYALRGAGLLSKSIPKGASALSRALQTGFLFGTRQTTEEIRKATAEAIYDEDFGARGGEAVRESFIFGAVLSLAGSGFKGIWNKLRPTEQAQALKTLGLKKGASLQDINKAARIQAKKFHPDKVKDMRNSFDKVIKARDTLRKANAKDIIIKNAKQNFKTNLMKENNVSKEVADNAVQMLDKGESITKVDQMISQAKFGIKPTKEAKPPEAGKVEHKAEIEIYKQNMPNATEKEIVVAMAEDGLRPPQDMLEKYKDLPSIERILERDEIDRMVKRAAQKEVQKPTEEIPPRPLVNPKASALQQDKQLKNQQVWDRKYGQLTPTPEAKQPWEMTKKEFYHYQWHDEAGNKLTSEDLRTYRPHNEYIEDALKQNKPVPPEVLAEYPELKPAVETNVKEGMIKRDRWQTKEFLEGKNAAVKDKGENPYKEGSLQWKTWNEGWNSFEPAPKPQKPEAPKIKGRPGFVDLTPIANAGKQVKTTGEKAAKLVTRFGGLESDVKKVLIEYEEQLRELPKVVAKESIEKFGKLTPKQEVLIGNHIENPAKNPLPKELESYAKLFKEGQDRAGATLESLGYPADWPNQYRKRLQERLQKLEGRAEPDIAAIEAVEEAIKEAEGLEYFHHHYKKQPRAERILSYFRRRISKRPSGLLGRKIPTLEKARELGLEPSPLAVAYAHMMHSAERAQEASNLIKAINGNPNLSQWSEDAPEGWVYLDQSIFPDSVQRSSWIEGDKIKDRTRRRKYPVPIAEALHELTYARTPHALTRAYDKFNFAMKMIGFYNPLVMTKNDFIQGWRASGAKYATKLPGALNTFIKKDEKYQRLRKAGLFNNVVSWTPSAEAMTDEMLKRIRRTWGQNVAADAAKYLNPLNIVKTIRKANDVTTWNMDEINRIACYDAIKDTPMTKGMTDFEVVELANDFMVNYAKLPKATKEHLSRVFFVPTYRTGNLRVWFGRILKEPWRYKGPLLRTVGYKMFIWFGLPALASAAVLWMTKKKRENIRTEKGYRLVIPNPKTGKDTVYSLSDPLLEGAKLTQRVVPHSLSLNLAAMPSLLLRLMSGPKFRNQKDPYGEFFKLGTPIYRDIVNWTDPDKTVPQKILTQLAIAYTYERKLRPTEDEKKISAEALAKALSIWTDWDEHRKEVRKTLGLGKDLKPLTVGELRQLKKDNTYKTPPQGKTGAQRKHPRYKNPELVERIDKEISRRKGK